MSNISNNKKNIIIIASIILGVILIAAGLGIFIMNKLKQEPVVEVSIEDTLLTEDDNESDRNLQNELIALNATYKDAIAWLVVPGTNIDTPVFKAQDNNRYLRNDRDGNATSWGETFMDYTSKEDMSGYTNLVVYGHNTTTDDHFTPLLNYQEKEFFDKNKVIQMSTLDGNHKWAVFSVFKTTADNYSDFYIDTNFENDNEFTEFVNYYKAKSIYDTGITVDKDDDILTLSTCQYEQVNGRFVVMAKKIK